MGFCLICSRLNNDFTTLKNLVDAALAVRKNAFALILRFAVGAALLDSEGIIHTGCNVENISYGLTICAERGAVMIAASARKK